MKTNLENLSNCGITRCQTKSSLNLKFALPAYYLVANFQLLIILAMRMKSYCCCVSTLLTEARNKRSNGWHASVYFDTEEWCSRQACRVE